MNKAQELLDAVIADNERLAEFVSWLPGAVERCVELGNYISGDSAADLEAIVAEDRTAVTPVVANQDSGWDAMVDHTDHMMRLLRIATVAVTAPLDAPNHCVIDPDGEGDAV